MSRLVDKNNMYDLETFKFLLKVDQLPIHLNICIYLIATLIYFENNVLGSIPGLDKL